MTLKFVIDGKTFETVNEYKTGKELKELAGIPVETDLYLSIQRPYEDELVANESQVNLARPEIEYFYVRKKLRFTINQIAIDWYKQYITVQELRRLGNIDPEHEVYLQIPKPFKDELISGETRVDLARPGVEHFISKKKSLEFTLIVNGRIKAWNEEKITFEQVVVLAFDQMDQTQNRAYTVTYSRGIESKPEGIMVKGSEVRVKDKMVFNVTATDKS
jgi:hypothetical protein